MSISGLQRPKNFFLPISFPYSYTPWNFFPASDTLHSLLILSHPHPSSVKRIQPHRSKNLVLCPNFQIQAPATEDKGLWAYTNLNPGFITAEVQTPCCVNYVKDSEGLSSHCSDHHRLMWLCLSEHQLFFPSLPIEMNPRCVGRAKGNKHVCV